MEAFGDPERAWGRAHRRPLWVALLFGLLFAGACGAVVSFAINQIESPAAGHGVPVSRSGGPSQELAVHTFLAFLSSDADERSRYVTDPQGLSALDAKTESFLKISWWRSNMRLRSRMITDQLERLQITLLAGNRPVVEACLVEMENAFRIQPATLRFYDTPNLDEWLSDPGESAGEFRVYLEDGDYFPNGVDERRFKPVTLVDVFSGAYCAAYLPRYSSQAAKLEQMLVSRGNELPPPSYLPSSKGGVLSTSQIIVPRLDQDTLNRESPKGRLEAFVHVTKVLTKNKPPYVVVEQLD